MRAFGSRFIVVLALVVACSGAADGAGAQAPGPVDPRLFVIGDSVMLGAHGAVAARLPGWSLTFDAQESRSMVAAPAIIAAQRAAIGEVVVVALGNNDAGNPVTFGQRVDGVMQALGGERHVIWVNLRQFASWVPAMDAQLADARSRWSNLEIADWDARATPDPSLVAADGLHLTPAGQVAMAELVAQHLEAYVGARIAAATTTSTTPTTTPTHVRRGHRRPTHHARHHRAKPVPPFIEVPPAGPWSP